MTIIIRCFNLCQNVPSHRLSLFTTQLVSLKSSGLQFTSSSTVDNYTGYPRIKICILIFKIISGIPPPKLSSLVNAMCCAWIKEKISLIRRLCNQIANLLFGNRMFEVADPAVWNSLPEPFRRSSSINSFETQLKPIFILSTVTILLLCCASLE